MTRAHALRFCSLSCSWVAGAYVVPYSTRLEGSQLFVTTGTRDSSLNFFPFLHFNRRPPFFFLENDLVTVLQERFHDESRTAWSTVEGITAIISCLTIIAEFYKFQI